MQYVPNDEVEAIRKRLDHPVIDADGHLIETAPVFRRFLHEFVKEHGGDSVSAYLGNPISFSVLPPVFDPSALLSIITSSFNVVVPATVRVPPLPAVKELELLHSRHIVCPISPTSTPELHSP